MRLLQEAFVIFVLRGLSEMSQNVVFVQYQSMLELLWPIWHTWQLITLYFFVVIFFGEFSISADRCNGSTRAYDFSLLLSLLRVAGQSVSVTVSCDEDVGEVDEVEELVDNPGTTNGA